jgi:transposase
VWRMEKKKIFLRTQRFGLLLPQRRNERRMDKCVAYGEKKIFPRTQRFGLLLPQRRNERRMDKCVAYGEKQNVLLKKSP